MRHLHSTPSFDPPPPLEVEPCPQGSSSLVESPPPSKNSWCRQTSMTKACEVAQRCLVVNFSLQLMHSPFSLHLYISSQEIFFVLIVLFVWLVGPGVLVGLTICSNKAALFAYGWSAFFCRHGLSILSSLILANSIASESVFGLNIWISKAMSSFSPPMDAPTNAFWGQPSTRLASLSNSCQYSQVSHFDIFETKPRQNPLPQLAQIGPATHF